MPIYLFGYGSLINLESASRTLKREIGQADVIPCTLFGFLRSWSLWDDVFSDKLGEQVRAIFLNIVQQPGAFLNGIIFPISESELEYFLSREKNYDCTDISSQLFYPGNNRPPESSRILTFVGMRKYFIQEGEPGYVFSRYINIVQSGVDSFGEAYSKEFKDSTALHSFPVIEGTYHFVDSAQQNAR